MSNMALLGAYAGQDNSALMFRNRVINGDMRVSQRYDNVAAHTITAGQIFYTIDRFFVFATGANVTGQRIAGTGTNPYVYRVTGAASNTQCFLIQRIEASNTEDLVSKTVTLQFEASATGITSLDYDVRVPSVRDNFNTTASVVSGTVTVSSTPTIFTVTCTLPANAANGIQINMGKTSGLVAAQTFSISGVQLEAGPTATPFERRPIGVETILAMRYYEHIVTTTTDTAPAFNMFKGATYWEAVMPFKVEKRATPSLVTSDGTAVAPFTGGTWGSTGGPTGFNYNTGAPITGSSVVVDFWSISSKSVLIRISNGSGTQGSIGMLEGLYVGKKVGISAEL